MRYVVVFCQIFLPKRSRHAVGFRIAVKIEDFRT